MKSSSRFSLITVFLLSFGITVFAQEPTPTPSPTPEAAPVAQPEAKPEMKPVEATSTDPKPTETTETNPERPKPTIYFYRIKQFSGSGLEPTVYCDEKELARMDNGRYFGVTLEPGKHTCRMGDKQTGFEIDVKPDQTYYAKVGIEAGFWKGHGRLTLIPPEQGAFDVKKVKRLGASKVKNRDLVTLYEGSDKNSSEVTEKQP